MLVMLAAVAACGEPIAGDPCGGRDVQPCEAGSTCLDDQLDDCEIAIGDPTCEGACYDCDDPGLHREYVTRDPAQCAVIDYACDSGARGFTDTCGCGCTTL